MEHVRVTPTNVTSSSARDWFPEPVPPPPLGQVSPVTGIGGSATNNAFGKTATFDGTGLWIDYKAHFETCCSVDMWNGRQKILY